MRSSRLLALAAAAALAVGLAGCASAADDSTDSNASTGSSGESFPVTIEHAFGETVIDAKPERVASVAWANHEVPLALGIVPVGMSKATWGDDDNDGILPWVEEKLDELGGEKPVLFDETDGIDYEAVADTAPDVILAAYSGLTQEEYDTLSKIAPVVAYPEVAWGTSVEDMIEMNSEALGLEKEGDALIEQLDADAEAALAQHPELKEAKVLFGYFDMSDLSKIGYYTAADTRPGYLHELGLPLPQIVADSEDSDQFYLEVSAEEAQRFDDVDLFVTYGDDSTVATLQADPLLSKIPAIAEGRIAILPDATPIAASANPSPLSIPWGLNDYFDILAAPLAK
ncbi:iron-siderophore ABC transporter substrate-binding protein [Microbacterium sp. nov. GSS16]|uniref:iron-siderophore ABC transporter substrate-binding protein n=1 Tax=Microbacterium sp. nov. GSS16 TaxID=3019890 RepID=UPI002305C634|nr:iron-siderophore ABC transporter substrate-binding protein [Microbacterium sp. nov. GSS16]WCD93217.1 iron-siderophore ABC transporter substrate-binding protein [Microbacterium sp. nov. GSS16]